MIYEKLARLETRLREQAGFLQSKAPVTMATVHQRIVALQNLLNCILVDFTSDNFQKKYWYEQVEAHYQLPPLEKVFHSKPKMYKF
ncbi:hypothetical protein [Effusibacillus dendaii]|uniref:Uncharacterized protein n=1 Tax=Effusibacillus dendaii TaxID=2743772 RepID=A0A7I8D5P3_9BACL|nr:hypothetical protein [Effusibacillus dendaii]BCJ85473.1 hypothetical protein skT53_04580 [Effusibacillus dendaii]